MGDGVTLNTIAIEKAFYTAYLVGGENTVYFPPGRFLTGAFNITANNTIILIDQGCTVLASQDTKDYPNITIPYTWGPSRGKYPNPFIYGEYLENITFMGYGVIDGQGEICKYSLLGWLTY